MDGFFRRNPILKTKNQFKIDSIYINDIIFDIIKVWFQKLKISIIKIIKKENYWNINKTKIIKN
jgi:hypothetical protein